MNWEGKPEVSVLKVPGQTERLSTGHFRRADKGFFNWPTAACWSQIRGNKQRQRAAARTCDVTAARLRFTAFSAVTSAEDPPRSALDLMNEQVCHVEIVILTTYISVSGLLWKSNWRNYSGGGTCVRGSGAFPEQSFLCGSNMETTHRLHVKFNQRPEILHWAAESDHLDLIVEQTQKIKSSASYCRYFTMSYEIFLFRREKSDAV